MGTHGLAIVQPIRGETGHAHSHAASVQHLDPILIDYGRMMRADSEQI